MPTEKDQKHAPVPKRPEVASDDSKHASPAERDEDTKWKSNEPPISPKEFSKKQETGYNNKSEKL